MIRLKFTTLTPLHISNGNELSFNIEYVERDKVFAKLNLNNAAKKYVQKSIFDFTKTYTFRDFIETIEQNKNIFSDSDFEYTLESTSEFLLHLKNARADGQKIVKEFINSNGKFYIPGSSVKGTIATIIGVESIGIKDSIKQKFVIQDSDKIGNDKFRVYRTYKGRPPINLICLKPAEEFSLLILKHNDFDLPKFKRKLKSYYIEQIDKAKKYTKKYFPIPTKDKQSGAELFYSLLEKSERWVKKKHMENEYLINIGFGSGSYFKLFNTIEKIPSKYNPKTRQEEEPHTTFSLFDGEYLDHIGWCKLTIEEE